MLKITSETKETENGVEMTISVNEEWQKRFTVQGVVEELIKLSPELGKNRKTAQAMVKRLVHHEKGSLLSKLHCGYKEQIKGLFLEEYLRDVGENHLDAAYNSSDDALITWKVKND